MKEGLIGFDPRSEVEKMREQIRSEARQLREERRNQRLKMQADLCEMGLSGVSYKHYDEVMRNRYSK